MRRPTVTSMVRTRPAAPRSRLCSVAGVQMAVQGAMRGGRKVSAHAFGYRQTRHGLSAWICATAMRCNCATFAGLKILMQGGFRCCEAALWPSIRCCSRNRCAADRARRRAYGCACALSSSD